jgi:hypothetical protein
MENLEQIENIDTRKISKSTEEFIKVQEIAVSTGLSTEKAKEKLLVEGENVLKATDVDSI